MPNPDTAAAIPGRTGPPWTAEGTVYFFGGWLSNFAPTPGLRLPSATTATTRTTACRCARSSTGFRRARRPHAGSST